MLSPNTLLNKARYRVDGLHLGGSLSNVYTATDQTSGSAVLVIEFSTEPIEFPRHEGLLRIAETFLMNGRRYDVTEPVRLDPVTTSVAKAWDEFSVVLMALNTISAAGDKRCEICPKTLIPTANGVHKLLPLGSAAVAPVEIEAWYVPLERIWKDLDHVSERAIYNAWGESSVADLEGPLDASSDIYSAAALFYRMLTGTTPPSAFERTVVGLDGSDPLLPPETLVPQLGGEAGAHLLRCLEVRRTERFRSFEEAIMSLPTLSLPQQAVIIEEHDVLDLGLSIPAVAVRTSEPVMKTEVSAPVTVDTVAQEPSSPVQSHAAEITHLDLDRGPETSIFAAETSETASDISVANFEEIDAPIFTAEAAGKNRSGMKFAIAGVMMAAVAGIGWGAYQYSQSNLVAAPMAVSAQVSAPIVRDEPIATPSPAQADQQTFSPVNVPSEVSSEPTQVDTSAKDSSHQRPQIAAKATPKTASTDKPKKKVTVDDLINDN
jgi:hypothetical protein